MMMWIPHYSIVQNNFTALKILCVPPHHLPLLPNFWYLLYFNWNFYLDIIVCSHAFLRSYREIPVPFFRFPPWWQLAKLQYNITSKILTLMQSKNTSVTIRPSHVTCYNSTHFPLSSTPFSTLTTATVCLIPTSLSYMWYRQCATDWSWISLIYLVLRRFIQVVMCIKSSFLLWHKSSP